MKIVALGAFICLLASPVAAAVAGDWSGDLNFPNGRLRFVLHVTGPDNDLRASADSPNQNATNLVVDAIQLDGTTLSFRMTQLNVRFSGRIAENEIRGTFTQNGVDVPLVMTRATEGSRERASPGSSSLAGDWQGTIALSDQPLRFVLHISGSDDDLHATADSPDQNAFGMPVDSIIRTGEKLHFTMTPLNVRYDGSISSGTIRGTFSQNSKEVPLTLSKAQP